MDGFVFHISSEFVIHVFHHALCQVKLVTGFGFRVKTHVFITLMLRRGVVTSISLSWYLTFIVGRTSTVGLAGVTVFTR